MATLRILYITILSIATIRRINCFSVLPSLSVSAVHDASPTKLCMVRGRGLEIMEEGATPLAGGMTLYVKAGPDGESVGDCPFAHYVRMVLEEKNLEYTVRPCASDDDKPAWLLDYYEGAIPALRHRQECYTESDVIARYLDFFFQDIPLGGSKTGMTEAGEATAGFFPSVAKYLKHSNDGDAADDELKNNLLVSLTKLESRLGEAEGEFLVGNGEKLTMMDCALAPKLYHLQCGLEGFKENAIDLAAQFPALSKYMDTVFARPSFVKTTYPKETVVWGWGNARN